MEKEFSTENDNSFKDLEFVLLIFRTILYQRVSTLVSITYDGPNFSPDLNLSVTIRFYDFENPFDKSQHEEMKCASVEIPENPNRENIRESIWNPEDEDCQKVYDGESIICICNKPGTFALVQYSAESQVREICFLYFRLFFGNIFRDFRGKNSFRNRKDANRSRW